MQGIWAYRPNGSVLGYTEAATGVFDYGGEIADRVERVLDANGSHIGWKYITEDDDIEQYDLTGKLVSVTTRAGVVQTLSYGSSGMLASVTDSFGHALGFTWNADQRLVSITPPDGSQIAYTYDSSRNLTQSEYPDGSTRTYHYEMTSSIQVNLLTGITDESVQRYATFGYYGSAATSTEHAGGVNRYSFTSTSSTRTVTDPLGVARAHNSQVRYGARRYTSSPSFCDGCAESKSVQYDLKGNVSAGTDFNNIETRYTYDLSRTLETSRTEAYGTSLARTITTQWHPTYRLPVQIDEPGKRTTFTRDATGNVLTRTVLDTTTNVSRAWTYTYNSFGQVLTADGPRADVSDVTTYTYYSCVTGYQCGQVQTVTNAAGHVTTYNTYNAHGQPLTITDPNGVVRTLSYDLRQRLTSRTVAGEVTMFSYWPTGLLKKAALPDGSYLEYTYDAAHRLTDINDAEGNRIHYMLDAMGNRTNEQTYDPSNALARSRTRVFNTLNRLHQEIGAAGTASVTSTYGYDNNGNQTSLAAPLGRDTAQGYDELNRLTTATDPLNGVTQYGYNALDQLISVTDPRGLVTSYSYNALGDLQQQTSPDTWGTANTYDSAGNLATSTDARNAVASHTYDELHRVATTSFSAGGVTEQVLTYIYDAGAFGKGRLTGAYDASHSLAWTYDEHGRALTATQVVDSISKTTSYTYANGLRQSMTTPSGQVITYGYTNGKVTSISVNGTVIVSGILYDPFGPVRQWTWADGSLAVRTFDQDGSIALIDSAGLKTYSYDDAFRVTGITDTTNSAFSWTYGYDDLDRLTSASKSGTTIGYTYDANGNRLTETGSHPSTFTIAANSNRLSVASGALSRIYGYDDAGNTTSFTGISFTYNNRGRMSSSTKNGVTTNYVYNALGQLVKKAGSTLYYYDDAGHVLGIYDGSGALTEEIVWLGDTPIATLRPQSGGGVKLYNIHTDHLNAPRVITDSATAAVRWRWDGEPFGGGATNDDPSGAGVFEFNLRFPGQIAMAEMGLHYNYHRDYDPPTGRYVESDPIGLKGGLNTYAYVKGNPLQWTDPLGLAIWLCNRKVSGFPGFGNHGYLWNDKSNASCGMQGSFGFGPTGDKEKGPSVDFCVKVDGSDGLEDQVMSCCKKNANNGLWFPGFNDCHNAANDCIKSAGLTSPGSPGGRLGAPCSGVGCQSDDVCGRCSPGDMDCLLYGGNLCRGFRPGRR
ncbi:hypothetical protein GCM10011487_33070 [Steroidobacter agaridevorans]|uniref:Teneurin-like YD-shell domain-containing protein n=1 Tax=Steroidobacter agaridevorans TaxID=2695856 RepID=A0A829YDE7_9GAMM|nr:hypothetical protein GCM10011487_33070 [Steroidobacter agaridevorans]